MAQRKKTTKRRKRRSLAQQIADMEAEIARLRNKAKGLSKFEPATVKSERERLSLSAADYARLVGVSPLTIYAWEQGRSRPREQQVEKLKEVHGITRKSAWKALGLGKPVDGFSAKTVLSERKRLELSAADYGELVGVSGLTIYNWEKDKSRPRKKQLAAWHAVKGIGKREAWNRLGY